MRESSFSQGTIQPCVSIIPFLVFPLIPFKTPADFLIICPPASIPFPVVPYFADYLSTQRQLSEPRSIEYLPCRVCSVSLVLQTLEDPLSQQISITIAPSRLAVTEKRAMPSTICSLSTPSCIPFRHLKPTLSPVSAPYEPGCQYCNTRVIAFAHLIPLPR